MVRQIWSAIDISSASLKQLIPSPEAIAYVSESCARRLNLVPLAVHDENESTRLLVVCSDPGSTTLHDRLRRQLPSGIQVHCLHAAEADIADALSKCYSESPGAERIIDLCRLGPTRDDIIHDYPNVIVYLVEALILQACRRRASDIHVCPEADRLHVRFRIDGVLTFFAWLNTSVVTGLLVRIKVLAGLDIAECRHPQDGQFMQLVDGYAVDFRVSTFPTVVGENLVIRVLRHPLQKNSLSTLGLPEPTHMALEQCLRQPNGMLVVCGPTGSGKSTTLYSLLNELDHSALNIMTLEDPVELNVSGIRQSNIDASQAFDYAQGLRAMLRQDPDVLMIGEIRDSQSCSMAFRAAMTGHQVFTTVHASSVFGAVDRLFDLGALPAQLAANLVAIASQRLLRKRCTQCYERITDTCGSCLGSGYFGRHIVMELLVITPRLAELIASGVTASTLRHAAFEVGFVSLREQAMCLVRDGRTTMAEVHRVLGCDAPMTLSPAIVS